MAVPQHIAIAETIRSMKLALKRKADESDSDEEIRQHSNRGNKLKRKAHNVREGRLDTSGGQSYRRQINHAGYQRYIIHENPILYDHDGDVVDPDDDYDEDNTSPVEDNPFEETLLENILMPLTSPAELADHPALSAPYTTRHITEMAENAQEMLHRERETLAQLKALLETFRGDERWVPLEATETAHDPLLLEGDGVDPFHEDKSVNHSLTTLDPSADGSVDGISPMVGHHSKLNGTGSNMLGIQIQANTANGVEAVDMAREKSTIKTNGNTTGSTQKDAAPTNGIHKPDQTSETNGDAMDTDDVLKQTNGDDPHNPDFDPDTQPSHAMTTRAKARTPPPDEAPHSILSDTSSHAISAFFLPPTSALPDQTLGLPLSEADETKRALLLYVQKQEEVIRGIEQLLFGLLKADRMRKEVMKWCKADGHVGELSDGEDWYDKDEWGLVEDLVKGKEEEEVEDEGKRRGRRREGKGRNTGA
ncbi:RXT2-like protein [Elsinoe ampelina]|uniref:RXT2-like protein n=1 Tax=Elsinoe ampelina TaxID=302913 RepID=A0A6A6GBL6_9PEZI|nr:RXT2-like protein [Elsinoe ampelina]